MRKGPLAKKVELFFSSHKRSKLLGPIVLVETANSAELQIPIIYLAHAAQRVHGGILTGYWARESQKNWRARLFQFAIDTLSSKRAGSATVVYQCAGIPVKLRPRTGARSSRLVSSVRDHLRIASSSRESFEKFSWSGAHLGDLVYDEWLKRSESATIDLADPHFHSFLDEVARTVSFWVELFESREISAVVSSGPYLQGIPLRIATSKSIPAYGASPDSEETRSFSADQPRPYLEGLYYRDDFMSLAPKEQATGKLRALRSLRERIDQGKPDQYLHSDVQWRADPSEHELSRGGPLDFANSLPVVFVSPHHFNDSPHVYMGLYPDYECWLWAVGKNADPARANWIIKGHPDDKSELSKTVLNRFLLDFPFFRLVPSDTSNKTLLAAGVTHVQTIYGSIGIEMAYLGRTVINASPINPHCSFGFNLNPLTRNEFEEAVRALPNVRLEIDLEEVYACYYMHYLRDRGSFFRPSRVLASEIEDWYIHRSSRDDHERIVESLESWIRTGEYRLPWSSFGVETTLNSGSH